MPKKKKEIKASKSLDFDSHQKHKVSKTSKKLGSLGKDDKILFAFLATFLSIIGFIIALITKRDDKYVMFYAKQSLVVFIAGAALGVIAKIFLILPVIGAIINFAAGIIIFILWLLSWIYALSDKEKEVPIIGKYARNIKL